MQRNDIGLLFIDAVVFISCMLQSLGKLRFKIID